MYQEINTFQSPNCYYGRPAGPPAFIVIHHWGKDGQNFDDVVRYLCRPNGDSSAHYVAEAGKVACIVLPSDRAWHAKSGGNPRGIGIECRPECSAADRETVAELIANLRKTYGYLPLYPHSNFVSTACPGRWLNYLSDLDNQAEKIRKGENEMTPEQDSKLNWLYDAIKVKNQAFGYPEATHNALGALMNETAGIKALLAAQTAAIEALANSKSVDASAITNAINQAVASALHDLKITLTTKEK